MNVSWSPSMIVQEPIWLIPSSGRDGLRLLGSADFTRKTKPIAEEGIRGWLDLISSVAYLLLISKSICIPNIDIVNIFNGPSRASPGTLPTPPGPEIPNIQKALRIPACKSCLLCSSDQ